jgi:hypothetical protein
MKALRASTQALLLVVTIALPRQAAAWIYPEHRDIANAAVVGLPPEERAALDKLWAEGLANYTAQACATMAAGDQGLLPPCVDFAAWPAIAGDHSCSSRDLAVDVVPGPWILPVSRVAAETKAELAAATTREQKLNRIATSNIRLQSVDPEYVSRAQSNIAHFLQPRSTDDVVTYMRGVLKAGTPVNALGLYVQYHLAAIAAAQRFATSPPDNPQQKAVEARRVFALEAFAIHWLEDMYAAGHVVGTWGSVPWRLGTHNYYNEFGFDGSRWNGEPIVLFGDSNMKSADLERAAKVVGVSLAQVARALTPGDRLGVASATFGLGPEGAYVFNVCTQLKQPAASDGDNSVLVAEMRDLLLATPVPDRGEGDVHLPRFREELGPFVGIFGSTSGGVAWGGLVSPDARVNATLATGLRLGFGAENLTGTPGTSTAFLEGGIQMAAAEVQKCGSSECSVIGSSSLFPAAPARTGLRLGLRLPFWLIPGDTLLLTPILALVSPRALSDVGVAAANGGLIPYERTLLTGAGSFQLILGREVQGTIYGVLGSAAQPLYIAPIGTKADGTAEYGVVSQKSIQFAFPVVEWVPFRAFATQLTFAAAVQLGFGVEVPLSTSVKYPADREPPSTPAAWNVFIRGEFDGRYFLGAREDLQKAVH